MRRICLFSLLFCLIIISRSTAQTGDIRGFVYEEGTGEPAPYANVYLKGTTHISQTNLDGFFVVSKVPAGDYTIIVTTIGYDTIQQPISVRASDILTKKFFLK